MAEPLELVEAIKEESTVITKDLLETAVRSKEGRSDIRVKSFTIKDGGDKGAGYSSVVFVVKVTTEENGIEQVHDLFIKTAHNNEYLRRYLLGECRVFSKEDTAYSCVIPDMIRYQTERGVAVLGPSAPAYYHSVVDDSTGILILQNMRPQGYVLADKKSGLNYEHCKLVMKELATLHSLSYAIKDRKAENMSKYRDLFHDGLFPVQPFMVQTLHASVELVKSLSTDSTIKEHVDGLLNLDLNKTLTDLVAPVEPYALFCHGDVWCNNLLFNYRNGMEGKEPAHVVLVDFQVMRYSQPTTDLAYFFYTSTTKDTRKKHLKDLLHLYHSTLMDCLGHLGLSFPEFTPAVLEKLFKRSVLYGVLITCMYLPAILLNPEDGLVDCGSEDDIVQATVELCKGMGKQEELVPFLNDRFFGCIEDAVDFGVL